MIFGCAASAQLAQRCRLVDSRLKTTLLCTVQQVYSVLLQFWEHLARAQAALVQWRRRTTQAVLEAIVFAV